MKKLFALALAALMLLSCAALAEDAFTSASVMNYYGDSAMIGDDLMNAMNSYSGTYLISTVNPDGSPNLAYFIYGCVKNEDKYYAQLGLAENQSRENILRTGEAEGVYAAAPSGELPYSVAGARMILKLVTDEELFAKLNTTGSDTVIFMEIVETKPLG